jgi:4-hydroxybenzoyl-CoA thioesterase
LIVRVQVGWGDCDPAGIVFYPRFHAWMDAATHRLARELGVGRDAMILPGQELLGFPAVTSQAEFVAPALMDDQLEVRAWVTRVGRTSLGLRYEIVRLEPQPPGVETLIARGKEDRVFVAHDASGLKARTLTPWMRQVLARFADPAASADVEGDGLR